MAYCAHPELRGFNWRATMIERTCAACDYKLDDNAIKVTIGGRIVEVCCNECAEKLQEAKTSASSARASA
jgi:hypothetical protein